MKILIKNQKKCKRIKVQLYFYEFRKFRRWKEKYINSENISQLIWTTENANKSVTRKIFVITFPTIKIYYLLTFDESSSLRNFCECITHAVKLTADDILNN